MLPIIFLNFMYFSTVYAGVSTGLDWLQVGCTLEGKDGSKKSFPGHMCIFQDDGTFISASGDALRKFSKTGEILWQVPGSFHHQLNLSPDKKRILTLSNEVDVVNEKKRRQDALYVIDQEGKILARTTADDLLKLAGIGPMGPASLTHSADFETSHLNSIYEIPSHRKERQFPWLKPGNVIVNGLFHGIFVLSPDLKTLHRHVRFYKGPSGHRIHDVQVTGDGNMILFNNHAGGAKDKMYSAIQKIDPKTEKVIFEFTARPKGMFYSEGGGGVQVIGDKIFFNHSLTGGYLYSLKSRDIVRTFPQNTEVRAPGWIQEIKMVDASEFLKNAN